jgi:hypothetical protein
VKAGQQIENLAENGHGRAFTPALILFIALPEPQDKSAFAEGRTTLK